MKYIERITFWKESKISRFYDIISQFPVKSNIDEYFGYTCSKRYAFQMLTTLLLKLFYASALCMFNRLIEGGEELYM